MDPVTAAVVAAVVAGATAGLTDTASQAIKDAYSALKRLLVGRQIDVAAIERRPDSDVKRDSLAEDLEAVGVSGDIELRDAALAVIAAVRQDAQAGAVVGVNLERVEAAALQIGDVESAGDGVVLKDGRFSGDITIGRVRSGQQEPPDPTSARL